jgi:hypothetical protein
VASGQWRGAKGLLAIRQGNARRDSARPHVTERVAVEASAMVFIVFNRIYLPDKKIHYIQFGDACETLEEAQKLARFPNLSGTIIVDLGKATPGSGCSGAITPIKT